MHCLQTNSLECQPNRFLGKKSAWHDPLRACCAAAVGIRAGGLLRQAGGKLPGACGLKMGHQLKANLERFAGFGQPTAAKKIVVAEKIHFRAVGELLVNRGDAVRKIELLHLALPFNHCL